MLIQANKYLTLLLAKLNIDTQSYKTRATKQHISILQCIVRSLAENKLNEKSLMNNNSIDIACLQETHLNKNQHMKSSGYTIQERIGHQRKRRRFSFNNK